MEIPFRGNPTMKSWTRYRKRKKRMMKWECTPSGQPFSGTENVFWVRQRILWGNGNLDWQTLKVYENNFLPKKGSLYLPFLHSAIDMRPNDFTFANKVGILIFKKKTPLLPFGYFPVGLKACNNSMHFFVN